MATTAVFDNALLADAVNKASRVAPTKGAAFDKACGILFVVDTQRRQAILRATDLEVSYEQTVPLLEAKGNPVNWRIPSQLLQSLIGTLPMNEGNTVDFIDRDDESIRFKSGTTIAKLNMLPAEEFPQGPFEWNEGEMLQAHDLSYKVEQVAWACDPKSNVLSGVHMDGNFLVGCNQFVLASIPSQVPISNPVTVPLSTLSIVMKSASDCRIRTTAKRLQISLDEMTRTTTGIIEAQYPQVSGVMREDFLSTMKVHRSHFIDTLGRMMVLSRADKLPTLKVEVNGTGLVKMLTFDMDIPGVGRMQDSMDVSTDFEDVFTISLTPRNLEQSVEHARGDYVSIDFGHQEPDKSTMLPIQVRDDKGYRCYVMPKRIS